VNQTSFASRNEIGENPAPNLEFEICHRQQKVAKGTGTGSPGIVFAADDSQTELEITSRWSEGRCEFVQSRAQRDDPGRAGAQEAPHRDRVVDYDLDLFEAVADACGHRQQERPDQDVLSSHRAIISK
jgi:hypothetical protein